MRLRFGECLLDLGTRELLRGGRAVSLSPKAFELLALLADKRPDAVSKQQIHDTLWPGYFVSDGNLPNLVRELRVALRDEAHTPRIIRTVPRFGYAFVADVRTAPGGASPRKAPKFGLIREDREIALAEGENVLGRDEGSVAWIDAPSVSRKHALIVVSGDRATLEDLGSKNGTYLDGRRVRERERAILGDGHTIRIGTVDLIFRRYAADRSTLTITNQ